MNTSLGCTLGLRRRASAFTMVELLVVIAVIAVLIGLVVPGLAGARRSAQRGVCLSQLRQFGVAFENYRQTFDGLYPYADAQANLRMDYVEPWDALAEFMDAPLPKKQPDGIVTGAPWKCPSDSTHAKIVGFSYLYAAYDLMMLFMAPPDMPPAQRRSAAQRFATKVLESPTERLMLDASEFHGPDGQKSSVNVLMVDGSARPGG